MDIKAFEDKRWSTFKQGTEFRHRAALSLIEGGKVLDVGCGDGLLLSMLSKTGHTVFGADISDVAVAVCTKKGFQAEKVIGNTLPFSDGFFDTVIALDVLEHLYDPSLLLREMKRVSSGSLIMSVPNFSSLPARLQMLFGLVPENNTPNKGHVYWFNLPALKALLKAEGLKIETLLYNVPLEKIPFVRHIIRAFGKMHPGLFSLSFVVRCSQQ